MFDIIITIASPQNEFIRFPNVKQLFFWFFLIWNLMKNYYVEVQGKKKTAIPSVPFDGFTKKFENLTHCANMFRLLIIKMGISYSHLWKNAMNWMSNTSGESEYAQSNALCLGNPFRYLLVRVILKSFRLPRMSIGCTLRYLDKPIRRSNSCPLFLIDWSLRLSGNIVDIKLIRQ